MDLLHLTLGASLDELKWLSGEIAAFCDRNGLGEPQRYALQLACDEWVTNVVTHGYGGAPPAAGAPAIELQLRMRDRRCVELTVIDWAPPFNPLTHPAPDVTLPLEQRQIGGLGIHFIKRTMDSMAYARVDGRNRLVMTKHIRVSEGETNDERND